MIWKKGRGKLGIFKPLLGTWLAHAESDMGAVSCKREFKTILSGKYIQLIANWKIGETVYDEHAMIGVNSDKKICFWSFTSDGKQSQGKIADVTDIHLQAIGFEAEMPAGLGRMAYWPDSEEGFNWVVEAKTRKGWNRFLLHHYLPITQSQK